MNMPEDQLKRMVGCVNIDMVGQAKEYTAYIGTGNLDVRNPVFEEFVRISNPVKVEQLEQYGTSDDKSFRTLGIPSIMLTTFHSDEVRPIEITKGDDSKLVYIDALDGIAELLYRFMCQLEIEKLVPSTEQDYYWNNSNYKIFEGN